jgi:hypothetical protein
VDWVAVPKALRARRVNRLDRLFHSTAVRDQLQRLWDLMVVESHAIAEQHGSTPPPPETVTIEGYQAMHMRLGIRMNEGGEGGSTGSYAGRNEETGDFDLHMARMYANEDWVEDVERFSLSSHATSWIEKVRREFSHATTLYCQKTGFEAVFARYDSDQSGELDSEEFVKACREDIGISADDVPNNDLAKLFNSVDADESGTVDAGEFVDWLWSKGTTKGQQKLVDNRRKMMAKGLQKIKERFLLAAKVVVETEGWKKVFQELVWHSTPALAPAS